jgi:hypothetical protein
MAGINHIQEIYEKRGEDFLNNLLNNYVIISEKVDGTFFGVKKSKDDKFHYFKKSGEISYVDRVLMKYYNQAISYFESLDPQKRERIPSNFYFGFEYITRSDTPSKKYDRLPKNNLILSYIHKLDDSGKIVSTLQNKEQLDRWADFLQVEKPPIIFEGKLNDEQRTSILDFIHSPSNELANKFKTTSFTKYIISILNEELTSSFLKNDLDGNIDGIIFRFYDETDENDPKIFLAKLVDPIFNNREKTSDSPIENKSQDYIWLIVIDLMNQFEMYNLDELRDMIKSGSNFEEKYILLINSIFKDFISEYSGKYEGLQLEIPEYLKREEFQLDKSLILDPEVIKLINYNETYTEIYKILLTFFRKIRKRSGAGFFDSELLTQLNLIVAKIKNIIMGDEVYESLFPSFSEFIGLNGAESILSEKEVADNLLNKSEPIPINLLIGSFQPITMGHIMAAKKLKEKNGYPVILIAIKPEKVTKKSPFSTSQTTKLLNKVKEEYPELINDFMIIPSGQIEEILENIYPKYKPFLWGTSESRLKDYVLQMDYIKRRKIPLRLSDDFKLVELPIFVKSDDVLTYIKSSNFAEFKKIVPNSIIPEFFNLQKELSSNLNENTSFKTIFEKGDITADPIDIRLNEGDSNNEDVI